MHSVVLLVLFFHSSRLIALATGENAEAFLGAQGYIWDTQSDMALALVGALNALVILSIPHDKQLHAVA
ncbi:DUF2238 domain-containing protein [Shewanella psychromarinicola]|uniref:DUF2238 domain-containing protein n=1 Tax=Shewanella psychromarinicola TaxID=2487742 RepID=A0A3N4DL12_9GAMM|nr:DUF2238 domain-containing protein [Shewanella psychromarinicola]RPA22871.1 DUF2238 domain-containing protein [Shewanella psychromarinicola]